MLTALKHWSISIFFAAKNQKFFACLLESRRQSMPTEPR